MSIEAVTTFGNADPQAKFTSIQGLIAILNTLVHTVLPEDITPYVFGPSVPSVDNQDKPWIRTDANGRPLGTYVFFGGLWVREAPHVGASYGVFTGDPTPFFDGTGLGLAGVGPVALDYWGWALTNGNNGTINFSDKFLVMGRMDNVGITGYSAGWRTNITGAPLTTGGVAEITLDVDTTFQPATSAVTAAHYSADGNTRDGTGGIWGKDAGDGTGDPFDLIAADPGKPTPDPISIINPFYAVAQIQWVGYSLTP